MSSTSFQPPRSRDDYEIGIVCALPHEADAVQATFDKIWSAEEEVELDRDDDNSYTLGIIGKYHVVLAHMGRMGKVESSSAAKDMRRSFPKIQLCLLVGICGATPQTAKKEEILLGDVIISTSVIQYDLGRMYDHGQETKNTLEASLGPPPRQLRNYLTKLTTRKDAKELSTRTRDHLQKILESEDLEDFNYPGYGLDHLYDVSYRHKHRGEPECDNCKKDLRCERAMEASCEELKCSSTHLIARERIKNAQAIQEQPSANMDQLFLNAILPKIYLGGIASGDMVMKTAQKRDDIASQFGTIGFEMEGAGIWDIFPTVVIKSVCDYADSHKNKKWQNYAAATAAACAKAFLQLSRLPTSRIADGNQQSSQQVSNSLPASPSPVGGVTNNFSGTFTGGKMHMGGVYNSQGGNISFS